MPALTTRFPLNDGGMFLDMTRDLQANHYRLPATTSYNRLDLPYAYPPLGFYLTALLSDLTRIPLLDLFLWLPAFLSILAIPAFYLFARALLADDLRAALATLFFALTPGSYFWPIMGGGVTRSPAVFFLLLAACCALRLFREQKDGFIFPSILFASLTVLSHPEAGLQLAGLCALFWMFYGRTRAGMLRACLLALGVTLLAAPWWGTVLARHGPAPFLSALQSGQHATVNRLELLAGMFLSGEWIPLLLLLRLTGLAHAIWKRNYILIALVFVPALLDPRSASAISFLAMCMLSALAFLDAIPALLKKFRGLEINSMLDHRAGMTALFIMALLLFLQCGLRNYTLINTTLTVEEREAMRWLSENISPAQNFYLVTGRAYSMSDPAQEWFPTLTGQHSQTTLQGLEWTLGPRFTPRLNDLTELQACAEIACVESWSARAGLAYDYLWIAKAAPSFESALASANYALVYESESLAVFARKK